MKIEGNYPSLDPAAAAALNTKRPIERPRADRSATTDQVQVSSAAQLAQAAITAATTASPIRPEAVARAKALMLSGTLGADAATLADALIDKTIEEK